MIAYLHQSLTYYVTYCVYVLGRQHYCILHITYYQQQQQQQTCGEQLCVALLHYCIIALLRCVALQLQLHITSVSIALHVLCNLLHCVAPAEDVW